MDISEVLNAYKFSCSSCRLELLKGEYINDTYRLINSDQQKQDYLLQKINNRIFKEPRLLITNIASIVKLLYSNELLKSFTTIKSVLTKAGRHYYFDTAGNFWRVFQIPSRKSIQNASRQPERALAWAEAFGGWLKYMDELPIQRLDDIELIEQKVTNTEDLLKSRGKPVLMRINNVCNNEVDYVTKLFNQVSVLEQIINDDLFYTYSLERNVKTKLVGKNRAKTVPQPLAESFSMNRKYAFT